ncbi:uncharacterized protein LOC117169334 [Belonocnema kinseyi]|uniref:uncharacterized protein LOC117169334 n=1 Tax=Belonocnema kinseyi TaxID=2817044 RepID=UPI00143D60DE|nr:uncharacterized protein LOC117169334 [Belonocnema kinseyi]
MFKLVALLFLASVVVAKPGHLSPILTDLVSEKVIESHGNSIVHSSAPVVQYPTLYSAPNVYHGIPLAYQQYQPVVYYK